MGNKNSGRRKAVAYDPDPYRPSTLGSLFDPPPPPGESLADRKVAWINRLTHTKGTFAGQPFHLRGWQERIIRQLFEVNAGGRRRYRTMLLMLPRKNGKSEICAALALDGLLNDDERGAEVYSAAADRDQASIVFNVAAAMIRNDQELSRQCDIHESHKRILHRKSGSVYRAISAESYSKHGFNASRIVYDELHAAPSRDLWDVLVSSVGARDQPLMIAISTAGYDRHSILWEIYQHAKKVAENPALDPSFLPIIYEAPPEADWTDEDVWTTCNPALGDFRSLEEMRIAAARAAQIPAQQNSFRRLYLNQWTESATRWLSLEAWDACQGEQAPLEHQTCYVGVDLSTTTDLTALVGVFPIAGGGYDVKAEFFCPEARLKERVTRDRVPYDEWARTGWLTVTPGEVVDYQAVRRRLLAWHTAYDLREIAYDPWNATMLITQLGEEDGLTCVPCRQGFASLSAPSKTLEAAILARTLRHDGNPIMRWMISNVSIESDPAGNIKPSKAKSTERIDGVVALVMAADRYDRNGATPPPASYEITVLAPPTWHRGT